MFIDNIKCYEKWNRLTTKLLRCKWNVNWKVSARCGSKQCCSSVKWYSVSCVLYLGYGIDDLHFRRRFTRRKLSFVRYLRAIGFVFICAEFKYPNIDFVVILDLENSVDLKLLSGSNWNRCWGSKVKLPKYSSRLQFVLLIFSFLCSL